ncbi:MAG: hypothetical protein UY52_C0023G0004 [Parcubacteria group bacterium GW2011_GWC2_49_9]|nr:MAG: hypothetical protein UY34_C0014G0003 [Parcubacteria group bacterium GW2011_GWA2_48_9]KKW14624.1 MAG: hypothetical protein UY52_C0023G0004 [Parcubacteria group bacterium GW2011_GWC2_49_9]
MIMVIIFTLILLIADAHTISELWKYYTTQIDLTQHRWHWRINGLRIGGLLFLHDS